MRKIFLIFFVNDSFDCVSLFEQAFNEIGFDVESIRVPNAWISEITTKKVSYLKELIAQKKSQGDFVVFSPQSTELFLDGPDLTITYSAYRGWFNPERMRVIPHLWTPVRPTPCIDGLRWKRKPPLRIGFMGRLHGGSRLAPLATKCPPLFRRWLLQGIHLRYPRIIGFTHDIGLSITRINAFARRETINALNTCKEDNELELEIAEKIRFDGSKQELADYINHLDRNTYIICPRGIENYSFRVYETLSRGRVPVIIDTNVVLPKEINWDRLSIRVPYESLNSICDVIMQDYKSRTGPEFIARQQEALSTMAELGTMQWVKDLAREFRTVVCKS